MLTAGAVSVALWVAVRGSRERRADERHRDERDERERMAQARLIAVTPAKVWRADTASEVDGLRVRNYSTTPVFDLAIGHAVSKERRAPERDGFHLPPLPIAQRKLLGPGKTWDIDLLDDFEPYEVDTGDGRSTIRMIVRAHHNTAEVRFVDSNGFPWVKLVSVHDVMPEEIRPVVRGRAAYVEYDSPRGW